MCKKFLFSGALIAVVAFVLFGTATFSHISHGVGWLRAEVEDSVPVEFKLDKAREAIEAAEPKIRELNRSIAEKQVEIRYLDRELAGMRKRQAEQKLVLKAQWEELQVERASYRFMDHEVSRAGMRKDADLRLRRVKATDQVIASKEERLAALVSGLGHVRQALKNLITTREQLITQCEMLEAKRRETEAKKASNVNVHIDGSDLAEAADILARVEKQLDVEMQVMENDRPLLGEGIPLDDGLIDVEARISAYLDAPEEPAALEPLDFDATSTVLNAEAEAYGRRD